MTMKLQLCVFLISISCALCQVALEGVLPSLEGETVTDYPNGAQDGNPQFVQNQEEETTVLIESRQSEVIEEGEAVEEEENDTDNEVPVSSSTEHWSTQGCTGEHEFYNACGPRCVQTCTFQPRINGRLGKATCDSLFSGSCHAGCYCEDGYVKFNNKCVKPIDCPTRACFGNEEFKMTGTACQLTCDSYANAEEIEAKCPKDIAVSGCFCKHGYVRSATGTCILPNRCPRPLVS